jgi:hypothetical protein
MKDRSRFYPVINCISNGTLSARIIFTVYLLRTCPGGTIKGKPTSYGFFEKDGSIPIAARSKIYVLAEYVIR